MAQPVLKRIETMVLDCTGEYVTSVDWASFIAITDIINENQHEAKNIMKIVQKRISKAKDQQAQMLSLALLETIVKNCECTHVPVGASDFQNTLFKMATNKKTPSQVKDKIVSMIQMWNHAFQRFDKKRYKFCQTFDQLLRKGVSMPVFAVEDQPPLFTPPPVQQNLEEIENEDRAVMASLGYDGGADGGYHSDSGSYSYYSDEDEGGVGAGAGAARRGPASSSRALDDEARYYQQQQQLHSPSHQQPIVYSSLPAGVQPSYPAGSPAAQQMLLRQQMEAQQRQLQQQYDAQQRGGVPVGMPVQAGAAPPAAPVDVDQTANAAELLRDLLQNVDLAATPDGRLAADELTDGLYNGLSRSAPGLQNLIATAMDSNPEQLERLLQVNDLATEALAMYHQLKEGRPLAQRATAPESAAVAPKPKKASSKKPKRKKAAATAAVGDDAPSSGGGSVDLLGLGDLQIGPPAVTSSTTAVTGAPSSSDWLNDAFGSAPPRDAPSPRATTTDGSNPFLQENPFVNASAPPASAPAPSAPSISSSGDDFDAFFANR